MINLDEYGGGCRCLLRARENEGKPGISDAAFIARFLPRYPEWQQKPGLTDVFTLLEIARAHDLAAHIDLSRDYDRVLREHRAGRSVLVCTERVPTQNAEELRAHPYTLLLVDMDDAHFTVWCPYPSGQSENLPRAARSWWDRWLAVGLVLRPAPAPA